MSADNGIYILVTKDSHKKTSKHCWENTFGEGLVAYRVAEAGAIDNLEWYERNEPYNIGYWLRATFGHSEPVYSLEEAQKKAQEERAELKLNGKNVVELDFKAMHASLLYEREWQDTKSL